MIQVDTGGHPPIPLGAPPLSLSVFQFRHDLLFLAVFRVMNFWSRFEALNDVFWASRPTNIIPFRNDIRGESCSPRTELSNDVSCQSNGDSMPKLRPWEVETPIYPNEAHSFGASSPRVRFFDI